MKAIEFIGWMYGFGTLVAIVVMSSLLIASIRHYIARRHPGDFGRWVDRVYAFCRDISRAGDARG